MIQSVAQPSLLHDDHDRISAVDDLIERSLAYRKSTEFEALLAFIRKFCAYSPFNCFLLHMQNPDASFVATPQQWHKRFGRTVKPGAHALVILAPMSPVLFVYDLADTEGPPLPESLQDPFATRGVLSDSVWNRTLNNCATDAISVTVQDMPPLKAGHVMVSSATPFWNDYGGLVTPRYDIRLNKKLGLPARYSTLVHELGHIYCGHCGSHKDAWWDERTRGSNEEVEFEAECVCHIVCSRLGLQTKSDQYLANYFLVGYDVPSIGLNAVLRAAGHIELMGSRSLPKKRK